jgi:hypothetical protein
VSQVNFFMMPEDEAEFAEVLGARGDTRVFPSRGLEVAATVHAHGLVLFNRTLGWPAVVDAIEGEEPVRAFTTLDSFKDPHVEWLRCYREGRTLYSGRLYAKIGWLDSPAANVTYRRWYDALARRIRHDYSRQDGWWVNPRASTWWQEGGLLSFGGRSEGRRFAR